MAGGGGTIAISTSLGTIRLQLLPDCAPVTCAHVEQLVEAGILSGCNFYRSDFVIQCGLHGSSVKNPFSDLAVNETHEHERRSNCRGTAAVAHWDVPDCGNSEFFINLKENAHLDSAYGGYCVFAQVDPADKDSFAAVDAIATAIAQGGQGAVVKMESVVLEK